MPKIFLKPGSADFAEEKEKARYSSATIHCEMPGCSSAAEHKAPKDRALGEYYNFCFDHVREYNKTWNFFDGMSDVEVEEHTLNSIYGDRPTWRSDTNAREESLRQRAWHTWHGTDNEDPKQKDGERDRNAHPRNPNHPARHTPEFKALALMGLAPPLTLIDIKTRYKELAMRHHPDRNRGCPKSEELLKEINIAYTVLKLAYQNFDKLPDRD